jgi:hypothetical protein
MRPWWQGLLRVATGPRKVSNFAYARMRRSTQGHAREHQHEQRDVAPGVNALGHAPINGAAARTPTSEPATSAAKAATST